MNANLMHLIADKQESGEEGAVITVIASNLRQACRPGTMMVVDQYGQLAGGGLDGSLLQEKARQEAEKSYKSRNFSQKLCLNSEEGSIEVFINILPEGRLIIVGSGSLVQDISNCSYYGYYISIMINRSEHSFVTDSVGP